MARPILHSPRVLRTGSPLSLEAIRQSAPAVFAQEPHSSRGPRYAYVPTIQPLQKLLDNGWGVYEVGQQRSRTADRDPYTKHMLRLRKMGHFDKPPVGMDGVPEVILINAHDGTAAYNLFAGFFRFVCSNGLISGSVMGGFKVRHTVGPQTSVEVLEAGEAVVTDKFPQLIAHIDMFRNTPTTRDTEMRMATAAIKLRYGDTLPPFPVEDLLRLRREEDAHANLWSVLNRIQENIMDGGWETRSLLGRKSMVKAVERVSSVAKINAGLWDEAHAIAKEA